MRKTAFLVLLNVAFGISAVPSFANKFLGRNVDHVVGTRQDGGSCADGCTPTLCNLKVVGDQTQAGVRISPYHDYANYTSSYPKEPKRGQGHSSKGGKSPGAKGGKSQGPTRESAKSSIDYRERNQLEDDHLEEVQTPYGTSTYYTYDRDGEGQRASGTQGGHKTSCPMSSTKGGHHGGGGEHLYEE
ncbi:hypothetical protein F5B20DRAFT_585578 [Whalleya microplaca]|nr:hypothetical protein F5B20DRAFT_585578 [Whalleya microplaca]